jgi:hypothetical protein
MAAGLGVDVVMTDRDGVGGKLRWIERAIKALGPEELL